jgi:asparagine synthase (glutamine-hydrolysing)
MCGIAGIYSSGAPIEESLLRRMTSVMTHRGPDDEGHYLGSSVGLGVRRLSIIDLAGGHQPIQNERRTLWIVFNGEIYNYRELRAELLARGHQFSTHSDTEVIIHLFEDAGPECLSRLNGMFAFAIWDEPRRELFVARDRLGVKPLYYWFDGTNLVFASELKALLLHPAVPRALDHQAVADYLTFMYVPGPKTPFRGVHKLLPGHYLTCNSQGLRLCRYWSLADHANPRDVSLDDAAARVGELLEDAVRLRLRSDVPVGAFLSGGMDSSSVVTLAARQLGRPLTTFSVGFSPDGIDELPYAREVATACGTVHHEIQVGAGDVIRLLPQLVWHMDEPNGDSAMIPTHLVSDLAATRVSVILTGLGGDELFAGYPRYRLPLDRASWKMRAYSLLPRSVRDRVVAPAISQFIPALGARLAAAAFRSPAERYLESVTVFSSYEKNRILRVNGWRSPDEIEKYYAGYPAADAVNRLLYVDAHTYLPDDILALTDRMSMAVSLEARTPFLDYRLVEYCAGLPGALKLTRSAWKVVLKRAMEPLLPGTILTREKMGFGAPVASWLAGSLLPYARSLLEGGFMVSAGVLDADAVKGVVRCFDGRPESGQQLWTLIILELWARVYLNGSAAERPSFSLADLAGTKVR